MTDGNTDQLVRVTRAVREAVQIVGSATEVCDEPYVRRELVEALIVLRKSLID